MATFTPSEIPVPKLHQLLLSSVAPRPIAWVSTMNEKGEVNLSPFSFFNVFSANPPIAIFSPARRGRDNTTKHTFENVKRVKECVINVVNYNLVQQCSLSSVEYKEGVNEFVKAGVTAIASEVVAPPRVAESPVQLECKVREVIELGSEGGAGNLVICEIVKLHVNDAVLDENGRIDAKKIDLVARAGGDFYVRAIDGLFEVPKPNEKIGIGIDVLPEDIRHSKILTGNDLGMLGNVQELPNETDVNEYKLLELSDLFMQHEGDAIALEEALHKRAAALLKEKKVTEALCTLLAFNN